MEELVKRGLIAIAFFTLSIIVISLVMDAQGGPLSLHLPGLVLHAVSKIFALLWARLIWPGSIALILIPLIYAITSFFQYKQEEQWASAERLRIAERDRQEKQRRAERQRDEEVRKLRESIAAENQKALIQEQARFELEKRKMRSTFEATEEALEDFI
jgi:hypothetical protein